jgi:hypothetical protein
MASPPANPRAPMLLSQAHLPGWPVPSLNSTALSPTARHADGCDDWPIQIRVQGGCYFNNR